MLKPPFWYKLHLKIALFATRVLLCLIIMIKYMYDSNLWMYSNIMYNMYA